MILVSVLLQANALYNTIVVFLLFHTRILQKLDASNY